MILHGFSAFWHQNLKKSGSELDFSLTLGLFDISGDIVGEVVACGDGTYYKFMVLDAIVDEILIKKLFLKNFDTILVILCN